MDEKKEISIKSHIESGLKSKLNGKFTIKSKSEYESALESESKLESNNNTVIYDKDSENFIFTLDHKDFVILVKVDEINDVTKFYISDEDKKLLNDMIPKNVEGGRAKYIRSKHTKSKHSRKTRRVRKSKRKGARKSRKH